jgi:hypothetical protein
MPDAFIHAMPAYIPSMRSAGIKWVSGYPENFKRGLPYITGLMILNDVETGMRAYYTGLPGTLFTVAGMPYTDGYLQWGLGLGYRTESAYWYLRGNGQHADNSNRFTLSAGLRIGF